MEYIDGIMIGDKIEPKTKQRKYGEKTTAKYMEQILKALCHCHSLNIVHRDLSPSNIMITKKDNIRVIDFGLSVN